MILIICDIVLLSMYMQLELGADRHCLILGFMNELCLTAVRFVPDNFMVFTDRMSLPLAFSSQGLILENSLYVYVGYLSHFGMNVISIIIILYYIYRVRQKNVYTL